MTTSDSAPSLDDPRHQTYYELLEVDSQATRTEIVDAYDRARAAFAPDSLATYNLFTPEEAQLISPASRGRRCAPPARPYRGRARVAAESLLKPRSKSRRANLRLLTSKLLV